MIHLKLKSIYSRLKVFLWVSILLGITLSTLQFLNIFSTFDALLYSHKPGIIYTSLPTNLMIFIVMFHTLLPGFIITEEGTSKGIILMVVIWFFYMMLAISTTSSSDIYIPLIAPILGCTLSTIRVLAWGESFLQEEKDGLRKTFGSLVEPNVADMLLNNPDMHNQSGVHKTVTILFADLRGFTRLCEEIPPEEVVGMLRECFAKLIRIARSNGGTVDKLIGDSMMVVWGNPLPVDHHAEKAVRAAIEMQTAMKPIRKKWQNQLGVDVKLGIGINTDEVVAGAIGSEEFCDYTVLGSGVNLAARLESACPGDEICVSESTHKLTRHAFPYSTACTLKPKYNDGNICAYQVLFKPEEKSIPESLENLQTEPAVSY